MRTKFESAVELLKRWDEVNIPAEVWTEPGEDYELPGDTQSFLYELSNSKTNDPLANNPNAPPFPEC